MDSGVLLKMSWWQEIKDSRSFTTLSKSGKIVNAYNALLMADKMSRK
jgi:hypothetical protein